MDRPRQQLRRICNARYYCSCLLISIIAGVVLNLLRTPSLEPEVLSRRPFLMPEVLPKRPSLEPEDIPKSPSFEPIKRPSLEPKDYDGIEANLLHSPEDFLINYKEMQKQFKFQLYPYDDLPEEFRPWSQECAEFVYEVDFFLNYFDSEFPTQDLEEQVVFIIPVVCPPCKLENYTDDEKVDIVKKYMKDILSEFPDWNKTSGADHVIFSCFDDCISSAIDDLHLQNNFIRVGCLPRNNGKYSPHNDVALPLTPAFPAIEFDTENRTKLGFWAGKVDNTVSKKLVAAWGGDSELKLHVTELDRISIQELFEKDFNSTKFCICTPGYRGLNEIILEAIYHGCVPVILSNDDVVLPFGDILDWQKFSVMVRIHDIDHLKEILKSIPDQKFRQMQNYTAQVQKHFTYHWPPEKYDAFNMLMYELWVRRHVSIDGGVHV